MTIAIIGGGAAGFMAAITAKETAPDAEVTLFEKSDKVLAKVKISGGGRCNVTHACFSISELCKHYPRGGKSLKKSFGHFYTKDTVEWFNNRGVKLKTESDNRMFPESNTSQTIVDCLMGEIKRLNIRLCTQSAISKLQPETEGFTLQINKESIHFDRLVIATGGSPKLTGLGWLADLGYQIEAPVPSLFTFNMPQEPIKELMGVVAPNASVRIQGSKLKQEGPLLITHWGMSGPAILKSSAFGARLLADKNYEFNIQVNWANHSEEAYKELIQEQQQTNRNIGNKNPFELPNRLWLFLLDKLEINPDFVWNQLGKKNANRLLNLLLNDVYQVSGKTTFKEEFVTCGGVSLSNINMPTMESKLHPGLFFAGEVLDIDGVTGGFNFQAAWTTGYLSGKNSA
jgi:predicted Rossmann fold flavoprotein